jgi:hypothetical protein
MFRANPASRLIALPPLLGTMGGIVSKRQRALSIGPVAGLDQGQEP